MLFLFTFNVPLAEFTRMLWAIILHEYTPLTHKLCSRWDHVMLQYMVITDLIQFTLHLVQFPDFAISKIPPHHNKATSMLYGWCDSGDCSSFTNSLPYISRKVKLSPFSRGWPEGSLFESYNTKVQERVLLLSLDCSTLPLIHT